MGKKRRNRKWRRKKNSNRFACIYLIGFHLLNYYFINLLISFGCFSLFTVDLIAMLPSLPLYLNCLISKFAHFKFNMVALLVCCASIAHETLMKLFEKKFLFASENDRKSGRNFSIFGLHFDFDSSPIFNSFSIPKHNSTWAQLEASQIETPNSLLFHVYALCST